MNETKTSTECHPDATELPTTFREFYPIYLRGHSNPWNRAFHFLGAASVMASIGLAIYFANVWIFLGTVVVTYAVLWTSHFLIEGNVPVTMAGGWRPVVLSWFGEFYMTWRFVTGRLGRDLRQFGIEPPRR